jgi:hypothetical protein
VTRSLFTLIAGLAVIAMPVGHAPTSAQIAAPGEQATPSRPPRHPRISTQSQSVSYTHYVRPDGSATSFCSANEPCSLPRAVSLIGSASMRPGSLVFVQYGADGVYSQAALTFEGSGTAGEPIRFIGENGVRITGTRTRMSASQWTRVPDREFTWRAAWDDAATFVVGNVAQRPPVTTWRPIRVDDRLPPFTQSLGRPFTLEFPIRYTARTSVATVEAQHCTFWPDRQNDVVYVHMCHDGPPAEADNVFLGPSGWGSVVINGDFLSLENIAIEQVTGTALKINPSAQGTVLRNVTARAAQVWLEGVNTVAEDLDVSHVITQGVHPTQCYDANPDFGRGECWNASGDGRALLVGRQGRDSSTGQVVRRARVHRSWNGARIDGRQTLEDSTFWGFPNHSLEVSGTGGVVRDSVFLNGQDSIYLEGEPFDDLTVEHNVFVNSALFWVSRDRAGGRPPSGWRFRHNILGAIVYDDKTYPSVTADCNLWIASSANPLMKVTGTDGASDVSYPTLDMIRSQTPLERSSMVVPASKWTDGTLFRRFTGQSAMDFDFTPVNPDAIVLCGQVVGPDAMRRAVPRREN